MRIGAKCLLVLLATSLLMAGFTTSSIDAQGICYGGKIDHLRFRVIHDSRAQLRAVQSGHVDILPNLYTPLLHELRHAGLKILTTPCDNFFYVAFNMRQTMQDGHPSPFGPQDGTDPGRALRHAIAHLVPKTITVGTFFKYVGKLIDAPMSAAIGTFDADNLDPHPFDMDMAKDILLDAGFTWDGSNWYVPATVPSDYGLPGGAALPSIDFMNWAIGCGHTGNIFGEIIVQNMRDLGFSMTHSEYDPTTMVELVENGEFDMFLLFWNDMGRFGHHLYDFFHSNNDFPGGNNYPGLRNDTLDEVLWELYTTSDPVNQRQRITEALEMLVGTGAYSASTSTDGFICYVPLYSRIDVDAYDSDLTGVVIADLKGSWNYWTVCNFDWDSGSERWSDSPIFDPGTKTMVIFTLGDGYQYPANPAWVSSTVTWDQLSFIYDSLIGMNPYNLKDKKGWLDLSRDPSLDTTPGYNVSLWTVTDGPRGGEPGMKVTFYLNTTVTRKWHDGHDWDVYDVAFAWEYLTVNKIPKAWPTFRYFHHCEVEDASTITAYMTAASIVLPYSLSEWSLMFPEHVWGCTYSRGGRAHPSCTNVNRKTAWDAQLTWITAQPGGVNGTAGIKPGTDADAGVESGLCTCAVDPAGQSTEGKLTCEHLSGCVLDDHTTPENEILDYNPAGYAWPTGAYPWLTEQVGTGPYVFYDINEATGLGNLIVFDERTHATVQPGVHYPRSVDEMHTDLVEFFWELGDANLDGQISMSDFALMSANFMMPVPPAPWRADTNQDGWINIRDMSVAAKNYGEEREH